MATKSFLHFREATRPGPRVTKYWDVYARSFVFLGAVSWYSQWRRYTFRTGGGVILDAACMRELADFVETQTREHNAARAAAKA